MITRRLSFVLLFLALGFSLSVTGTQAESASPTPTPVPAPTPVPLPQIPAETESAFESLQETETNLSRDRGTLDSVSGGLLSLRAEIDDRIADDTRILAGSPSLELLYRLRATWQNYENTLAASIRDLTQRATNLDQEIGRLAQLDQIWKNTAQSAAQVNMPPAVLKSVQSAVDAIARKQEAAEADRTRILTLQNTLSGEEARVRRALESIKRAQDAALKDLLVRDRPPIWADTMGLTHEWETQSGETFSSQLNATTSFATRLPQTFVLHTVVILLVALLIHWIRRKILKMEEVESELQRAVPILDLPISTAFVLSLLLIPSVYPQAPRWIQAIMGAVALVPTLLILRRLLERSLFPILYALAVVYFVGQLRVITASLPALSRLLYLGQMLGAFLFLVWLIRRLSKAGTKDRFTRAVSVISKIGLVIFPVAILANIFGYVSLSNLLGMVYIRSIFLGALLYVAIRALEGFVVIALQVRPLGALHVVRLHRPMLHRRICRLLEFLAFLFWLGLMLNFFGLRDPLLARIGDTLNADITIGSLSISLGRVLSFIVAVWASFLVSKFLRFLLAEDVFQHFQLSRGLPYAISTMLHYLILLLGFFLALGALGIDLTKITILAGAFSVGVGFGLQNVINNFVSGLILLFERPIKIGDVIEIGGTIGEVRRIGIRACVIRTPDGSEIIVPNGSLISNQVTNWTFSDRTRALEVAVNVVPGADSQRVVEFLKTAAAGQPGIAKDPAPQVYLISFTATATTYQVRAWTDRYQDWAQVRSDLAVAVNTALLRESIGIA
jgi:potassium efflux system protein